MSEKKSSPEEIRAAVEEAVKNNRTGDKEYNTETSLQDLGLDSLDVVTMVFDIEDALSIEIKDEDVNGLKTPKDVEDYLLKELGHAG